MKNGLNTVKEIEDELNIHLCGSSRQAADSGSGSTYWEFGGGRGNFDRQMRQLGQRGKINQSADSRQQRVIVKASYSVHKPGKGAGVLRAHVRYLGRDSASLDGEPGRFYDAAKLDVDAKKRGQGWSEDRHHFRFIVSPEHGHAIDRQPGGMTSYVRELMAHMARDLKVKLEWCAVNHHNTDETHAHVLVRGKREDGKDLVIPRRYLSYQMREAAQTIATRRLGERSKEQVREGLQKEIQADRYTALDSVIERNMDADHRLRLNKIETRQDSDHRRRVAARFQHLESMGLAGRDRHGRWTVDADLKPKLRELSERNDIIKNLYARLGPRSASVAAYRGRGEEELIGYVAGRGVHDELRDSRYLLVQDAREQMHYVRMANPEALQGLEEGGLVRVSSRDPHRARTDARIAEIARQHGGVYSRGAHCRSLSGRFAAGDVESFLRSHQRRLQALEKAGAVERVPGNNEGWTVRDANALARGEQAENRGGFGSVEIISARSIESQINAQAWTWLDRQMHRQAHGKPAAVPLDRTLEQAFEARRRWMIEHGYTHFRNGRYELRSGVSEALRQHEWCTVVQEQKQRFGKTVRPLSPGGETAGIYQGVIALHDGLRAVIVRGEEVVLAPVRRAAPLERGASVQAKVNARGQAILSRNDKKQRQRGLERG